MKYISVKEAAEKWGVSPALVRRYCGQSRIPNAKCQCGTWLIPDRAKKPGKTHPSPQQVELLPLAKKLAQQKKKKNYHGLYDYVQIDFTYSPPFVSANTPVVLFIHRSARDFHEKKSVVSFCQNLSNIGFFVASFSYIVNDNTPLIQQIEDIYSCINSVCERLSDTQADKHRVHLIGEGAETIPCLYSAAIQKNPVLVDAEYSVMCNMEISSTVLINGLFDLRLLLGRYKNLTRLRKELIKSILGLNRKPINTDGSLQLPKCLLISSKEKGRKHKSRTLAAIFKRNNIPHIQKEYQLKPQIKPYFPFVIPDSKEGHQVIAEIAAFITEFEEKY